MKEYFVKYSKTNKPCILEDNHFTKPLIQVTRQKPNYDALENVVELLNEKEKEIDKLRKENKFLKEYSEELETHIPKETLQLIKKVLLK